MFEAAFMRVALVTVLATSAPLSALGVYLIARRLVFLGLVLANAATVGAAVAQVFGVTPEIPSVLAAVAAALAIGAISAARRISAESLIGWGYATAASATVLILAGTAAADADTLHLFSAAVCAGLVAAFQIDLPPGPVSVAVLALMVPAAALVSRWQKG